MKKNILIFSIVLLSGNSMAEKSGELVYKEVCSNCHGQGVFGAPKLGDAKQWVSRISKGQAILNYNAIQGYAGTSGFMPPKGGDLSLTDTEIKGAVQYMINHSW